MVHQIEQRRVGQGVGFPAGKLACGRRDVSEATGKIEPADQIYAVIRQEFEMA